MAATSSPAAPLTAAPRIGVITVTHNSGRFFPTYMRALAAQTRLPDKVVLVDSGSADTAFLAGADEYGVDAEVVLAANVGFSVGNNMGWRLLRDFEYILFLNPDAFPEPRFLEGALAYMQQHPEAGMLSPTLQRYDIAAGAPLEKVDTTGVVRGRTGLAVERDAEQPLSVLRKYTGPNEVPWLCGAAIFARQAALLSVLEHGSDVFDASFFMYKEDTDLSWRVRRAGWKNVHHPGLLAYHCRGWQSRRSFARSVRLLSARNDVKMCRKNHSPFVVVACVKYLLVALFNL